MKILITTTEYPIVVDTKETSFDEWEELKKVLSEKKA